MGGGGAIVSSKGGRKSLDATINLVPFIDLLSCCISFLLITAVWVNLGRMEVASSQGSGDGSDALPKVRVTLRINDGGYVLSRSSGEEVQLPRQQGQLDATALSQALGVLHKALPDQHDLTLRAADAVRYAELIHTMDIAHAATFVNVQVNPE